VPITFKEANEFVKLHHRHHKKVVGCKFCISVSDGKKIRGVAIVGRPVARFLDDGMTLEVTRVCTDGVKNGCSILYGASWRVTRELGYNRLITYTLKEEGGASLRASGYLLLGLRGGGTWNRKKRPRIDTHPLQKKLLWERSKSNAKNT